MEIKKKVKILALNPLLKLVIYRAIFVQPLSYIVESTSNIDCVEMFHSNLYMSEKHRFITYVTSYNQFSLILICNRLIGSTFYINKYVSFLTCIILVAK